MESKISYWIELSDYDLETAGVLNYYRKQLTYNYG